MYTFVFYFIYKGQLKDNKGDIRQSRTIACMLVSGAIWFHLWSLFALAKYLFWHLNATDITNFSLGKGYSEKWFVTFLLLIPVFIPVYRYYNPDRIQEITDHYESKEQKTYSIGNFIKFFAVYFLPLIIAIYLTNHSVPRYY